MTPRQQQPMAAPSVAHIQQNHPPTLDDIATRTQPLLDAGRYQPKDEEGLERLARRYYMSGMLPDSYYPKDASKRWDGAYIEQGMAKAYLAMLKGAVLGIHPSEAIWQIHVINGRPTLSADLMFGRMLATGILRRDDFTLKADKTRCEIVIGVRTRPPAERMVIVAEYADFKHLHNKDNWKTDPEAMLVARCKSRACRRHAPDVFVGVYASEEARDFREDRAAGLVEDPVDRIMGAVDLPYTASPDGAAAQETAPETTTDELAEAAALAARIADFTTRLGAIEAGQTAELEAIRAEMTAANIPDGAEKRALGRELGAAMRRASEPAKSGEGGAA